MTYYRPPDWTKLFNDDPSDHTETPERRYQLHLCEWMERNGISRNTVVAAPVIVAGRHILFQQFVTRSNGQRIFRWVQKDGHRVPIGYLKRKRKIRMTSPWSAK